MTAPLPATTAPSSSSSSSSLAPPNGSTTGTGGRRPSAAASATSDRPIARRATAPSRFASTSTSHLALDSEHRRKHGHGSTAPGDWAMEEDVRSVMTETTTASTTELGAMDDRPSPAWTVAENGSPSAASCLQPMDLDVDAQRPPYPSTMPGNKSAAMRMDSIGPRQTSVVPQPPVPLPGKQRRRQDPATATTTTTPPATAPRTPANADAPLMAKMTTRSMHKKLQSPAVPASTPSVTCPVAATRSLLRRCVYNTPKRRFVVYSLEHGNPSSLQTPAVASAHTKLQPPSPSPRYHLAPAQLAKVKQLQKTLHAKEEASTVSALTVNNGSRSRTSSASSWNSSQGNLISAAPPPRQRYPS